VLEAKRLGHRAVLRLSWLLLVASVALSTLLSRSRSPHRPWLATSRPARTRCGCWAPSRCSACCTAPRSAPTRQRPPQSSAEVLTKRAQAERVFAQLSATGAPVSAGHLAAAAGLSASYARALVAQFQARTPATVEQNGSRPAAADADPEATS
jgi:hypothetical protein